MLSSTALLVLLLAGQPPASAEDLEFFEKRVRPLLAERCLECHSAAADTIEGGLALDSREAVLLGGDSGPAVVAGDVKQSRLIVAVHYRSDLLQMPPEGKLPDRELAVLEEWVRRGVPFPPTTTKAAARRTIDLEAGRRHWAFQPVVEQKLPAIENAGITNRLNVFLEAQREKHGLSPSPAATRETLIRRASFDLLGLPPSGEEVAAFVADPAPDAYERLVDRLLASPHHGERWGRSWLDMARYCDVPESWRGGEAQPWLYRDWVVRAFNRDLPYDDFVRQQFAADLLPEATPADNAALGFLGISPTYWKELKLDHKVIQQVVAEEWEEQIEAVGGTFLGLTVACARCHDHKFDPITARDYYALCGVLASIRLIDKPLIPEAQAAPAIAARAKAKQLQEEADKLAKQKAQTDESKQRHQKLLAQIAELKQTPHFSDLQLAPGIADARLMVLPDGEFRTKLEYRPREAQDVALHIRGNAANPGEKIPRRFLSVLATDPAERFESGSGRLELAEAIVTDSAPLAARVMVNRVWAQHFGRGLVTTPSNFGTTGDLPSHPELLDDLAARFIAHDWSLKWLHREIMLSAAYRQASVRDPEPFAKDPDNVWLWRMLPRRLNVEAWRDAMLVATGELDLAIGGAPGDLAQGDFRRRTLYGSIKRRELVAILRLHDFPAPVAHSAERITTTTPLQQLFTLNSPLMHERSVALAKRLESEAPAGTDERIAWMHRAVLGRNAQPEEIHLARDFIAAASQRLSPADAWRQYSHALLASNELLFVE